MNKTALAALFVFFISNPVEAGDMYAGVKWGKSRNSIPGVTNTPSAIGLFGGYTINPYLSFEAGYIDLGNFGGNKATAADISALFFYPGDEPFSLYAKLSYASSAWKMPGQVEYNSSFTQGLGFRYNTSASTSFRFAWDRYMIGNPEVNNVDVFYLAGIYRF
ncbi:MAG: outer membrane beta-barrel protein [Gallionella sp.]